MKRTLFLLTLLCLEKALHAQYIYTIKADSVKITNSCDTAELIIENHTQNVPGFLFNKGRGRTEFRKLVKLNDSMLILGGDTLLFRGNPTASNGLSIGGRDVQLGGKLIKDSTVLDFNSKNLIFNLGSGDRNFLINSGNYGFSVQTPAGSRYPQMNFYMADTVKRQGVVGFRNNANIDTRCLFLSAGDDYSYSQYPENGPGMNVAIWTGQNTHHATVFFRNGNVGIGTSVYRLRDKLAVAGNGLFTDTLKLPNIITKTDTAFYKPMVVDASGNVFKMENWNVPQISRTAVNDAGYSALSSDYLIAYTSLTAARTVTLPAASSMPNRVVIVKDESGLAATYNITVNVTAGGTIDGASAKVISSNYGVIEVYSNGSQYFTK